MNEKHTCDTCTCSNSDNITITNNTDGNTANNYSDYAVVMYAASFPDNYPSSTTITYYPTTDDIKRLKDDMKRLNKIINEQKELIKILADTIKELVKKKKQ